MVNIGNNYLSEKPGTGRQEAYTLIRLKNERQIGESKSVRFCSLQVDSNDFLLLVFRALNLSGLHTTCFFCNAMTVGCLGIHEPGCDRGLPWNLLLLGPTGVASADITLDISLRGNGEDTLDVRHILCGSHTNDCRPITRSVLTWAVELCRGVLMFALDSGRRVAMEALRVGWTTLLVSEGVALIAMEPRLAFNVVFPLFAVPDALEVFSLSSSTTGRNDFLVLFGGAGDATGIKLVILRSGNLIFVGAKGGFLSTVIFCVWFRDDKEEDWVEIEAKALFSCFNLVFLSSANWFSRSRTC